MRLFSHLVDLTCLEFVVLFVSCVLFGLTVMRAIPWIVAIDGEESVSSRWDRLTLQRSKLSLSVRDGSER